MKPKFKILPDFESLLPPLTTEEQESLKLDLRQNGILVPITVDEEGTILDGHHRYKLRKRGSEVPHVVVTGLTLAEKEAYIYRSNNNRRNLSPAQKKDLHKAQRTTAKRLREEDPKKWTQQRIAQALGVAQNTVSDWFTKPRSNIGADNTSKPKPDARVKVDPKHKPIIADRVASGESQEQVAADYGISQRTVSTIVKNADKLHSRDDDKARKTAKSKGTTLFDLRKGDFRKVLKDVTGIKLILTDPPYGRKHLSLWSELAKWASSSLAEDGILIAYSGQMYLPEVLSRLSQDLNYWWTSAVVHKGAGNLTPLGSPVRKVKNQWKPLVMFYPPNGTGFEGTFSDLVLGTGSQKTEHNWQQPVAEAATIIERFTNKGDLVVDPFAGSGGFCKAASDLGRQAIGAEIEQ